MGIMLRFSKGQSGQVRLNHVRVRLAAPDEQERWNELVTQHHYIGSARLTGHQLRYVAECRGKCVALLSFSACALHLGGREEWIGWSPEQQSRRRHFVVQNSRFLIMPGVSTPNLASRVLSLCLKRLSDDWIEHFGHPVVLVETFVESCFPGTSYRADNWVRLGETQGFSRDGRQFYVHNGSPKALWVKPLRNGAAELLASETLPDDLAGYERPLPTHFVSRSLKVPVLDTLFEALQSISDPRGGQGRKHSLGACLGVFVGGILAGCRTFDEIAEFGSCFNQHQRRALRMWRNPRTGRYEAPHATTIWRVMSRIAPEEFENVFEAWFNAQADRLPDCLSIDGKTLRGTLDENGEGLHAISAISHDGTPFLPRPPCRTRDSKAKRSGT